jgi:predicted transport protein
MEKFEKREAHPMAKYIGRLANFYGKKLKVVGYSYNELADEPLLIVDASQIGGWSALEPFDVIFKDCGSYWYANINDLID